ncbi:hypothetical protein CGRA01v4_01570 [Colletotrichum graminicola]|nr:hypothetical protein CGRA01v4_01570 [Colletotrichum graminicola]
MIPRLLLNPDNDLAEHILSGLNHRAGGIFQFIAHMLQ